MSKQMTLQQFKDKVERATFITIVYFESVDEEVLMTLVNEPEENWDEILLTACLAFYK